VSNLSTSTKNPTLATANIIIIKKWTVDITTKYISASLVTVARILDPFIPLCGGAMSFVCTRTDMKTTTSTGTDGGFNSGNGRIRKSGGVLTKDDREGHLKDCKGFDIDRPGKTQAIRIQRNLRYLPCWKYALSYGTRAYVCDVVEVLTWTYYRPSDQENSNTELRGGNCTQDACDPSVLPRYSVSPVIVKVSECVQINEETSDL